MNSPSEIGSLYENLLKFAQSLEPEEGFAPRGSRWMRCGSQGVLGASVPEAFGGAGLNAVQTASVMEAFGEGCSDMGLVFSVGAQLFACAMPVCEFALPEVKQEVLPGICDGTLIGANAITEAGAGSDAPKLRMATIAPV